MLFLHCSLDYFFVQQDNLVNLLRSLLSVAHSALMDTPKQPLRQLQFHAAYGRSSFLYAPDIPRMMGRSPSPSQVTFNVHAS